MTGIAAFTGFLVGGAYGYVAQRGAFCLNSGFRHIVTRRDTTKVMAYILAVAMQMVALPAIFALGLSRPSYPLLFPLGAVVGGLLFGASMGWAGGCAAGVWYKVGTGSVAALTGVAGMAIGAAAMEVGPLMGLRDAIQSVGTGSAIPMPDLLRVLTPLAGLLLLALLIKVKPGTAGAWSWRRTGLLLGLIGIAAWPLSSLGGRDFGMAVVPGTVGLLTEPRAALASWDGLFVLGIPLGGYLAARRVGSVRLETPGATPTAPTTARNLVKNLAGGIGLGVGASLAAGCTVGHGLAGLPLFAPGSILTMGSIFAGSTLLAAWRQRRRRTEAAPGARGPP